MSPEQPTIGVIGLGRIGAGVSRALARAGFPLRGYDVWPEALDRCSDVLMGAASPRVVADASEIVIIAVLDDEQVRDVLAAPDGLLAAPAKPRAAVLLSTVTLETVQWAGAQAERAGVQMLDCGVTGGSPSLATGSMTAMVGGAPDAFEYVRPVVEAFCDPVLHMGPYGKGMAAKLARNLLVYTDWSVAWEAARLAQAAGVDVEKFVAAVNAGDRRGSGHMSLVAAGIGLGDETDGALARGQVVSGYAYKDLEAVLALGRELGVDLPAAQLALSRMGEVLSLARSSGA